MADFVSAFWNWFIIIPTVIGIVILFPFIYMNRGRKKAGEADTTGHVWDDDLKEYNNPLPGWWLNMFVITLVFGLIYLLLYPGLGQFAGLLEWGSLQQYEKQVKLANETYGPRFQKYAAVDIEALAEDDEAMKSGQRLFANYCSTCHGSDARGAKGYPNLRDQDWLYGGNPEQIKISILQGRQAAMPPWEAVLGENGVLDVTEYVLSLSGRDHDEGAAVRGKTHFETLCAACHQSDGKGNPALGAPNLTNRVWLYGGSRKSVMASIAKGRNGVMPAHKEFLGEDRIHVLAAYVYSLSQEYERE